MMVIHAKPDNDINENEANNNCLVVFFFTLEKEHTNINSHSGRYSNTKETVMPWMMFSTRSTAKQQ